MNLRRFGRANHTSANLPHFPLRRSKRCMNFCQRTTSKTTKPLSGSNIRPSFWSGMSRACIRMYDRRSIFVLPSRALKPPGWHKEWHIGVRVSSNRKLVAFISGVPINLRVRMKWDFHAIYTSSLLTTASAETSVLSR